MIRESEIFANRGVTPVIMIGPGTGVAPMRSLIQDILVNETLTKVDPSRVNSTETQSDKSHRGHLAFLFFGCRKQTKDFIFQNEWAAIQSGINPYASSGNVNHEDAVAVRVAFSQDQQLKEYVTHKLRADGAVVWELLKQVKNVLFPASILALK